MATIQSLTESIGVLKRNPILFAAGALYAVIILPQTVLSAFGIPLVPALLQLVTFFVTPFVVAGILAMAHEGRVRDTSFETFKEIGKDRYVPVLLGNLLEAAFTVVYFIVVAIVVVFVVGFGAMAASDTATGGGGAMFGGVGIAAIALVGVAALLFLVVTFFIQFYAPAIVVDDTGVADGFRKSVGVVKDNIVPALGYSAFNLVVGLLFALPSVGLALVPLLQGGLGAGAGMGGDTALLGATLLSGAAISVYTFVVAVVMTPFRLSFAVSFYDNHTDG